MSIYESAVRGRQDFRSAYRVERERAKGLAEALAWIDQEAPGSEPRDCPTVGFQPSHDPEEDDGNDVVREAFDEGVARGLWIAAERARAALTKATL